MHKKEQYIYLTSKQIELIHSGVLARAGGLFGTRVPDVLDRLEVSPQQSFDGKELCLSIFEKAALYMHDVITQHPFLDGNKRTGTLLALTFLEVNGYNIVASNDDIFEFALKVVADKLEIKDIALWLKKHTSK